MHLGLASITSERRRLTDVIAQKLGRLALDAPVRGMELVSGFLQPLSAGSFDVFGGLTGTGGRDTAPQLVERLRARLGEDAVYGVASIAEHRPEAAWRRVHELSLTSVRRMGEKMIDRGSGEGMPRPVWLLDAPLALSLPDMQEGHQCEGRKPEPTPAGRPQGEGQDGPSQCGGRTPTPVGAPEGREPRMGERQIPGARPSHGARLWVFQERLSKHWYLHGVFA